MSFPMPTYIVVGTTMRLDPIFAAQIGWDQTKAGEMTVLYPDLEGKQPAIVGILLSYIQDDFTDFINLDKVDIESYKQKAVEKLLNIGVETDVELFVTTYGRVYI